MEFNPTKIKPVEFKVLIKVDELKDQSAGGIWIPESRLEREQMAHDRGVLVEKSDMSFSDWPGKKPEVGNKVIFSKYAGSVIMFDPPDKKPRERYRLCNDKDICAILEE